MPVIKHSRERLLEREVPPFRAAIASGVASVIVGHLMVPALQDPGEVAQGIPASMSRSILRFLRKDLAFEGVVMIDDIEMGAIAKRFSLREAVSASLQGGVDLFLVCHKEESQVEVMDAICDAVRSGEVSMSRFKDAVANVRRLVDTYASAPLLNDKARLRIVGSHEHREIVKSILAAAASSNDDE